MSEEQVDSLGKASVVLLRENPDGSADFQFNFQPEALAAFTRFGILTAIKAGIEEAAKLKPEASLDLLGDEDELV